MIQTVASLAAAGRRLHPVHVLAAAATLCFLSLLLHGQLQLHSQLRAAHKELADIKHALSSTGHIHHGSTSVDGSSSSSSSLVLAEAGRHSSAVLQPLVQLVRKQQQLLNSLPRGRNPQLLKRVQQLSADADSALAPAVALLQSTNASALFAAAAVLQHTRPPHAHSLSAAAAAGDSGGNTSTAAAAATAAKPGTLSLDLTELLGLPQFLSGITWEPKSCYSGLSKIFTDPADQAGLRDRLLRDLTTTMASVRGVEVDAINTTSPWWASIKGAAPKPPASILSDPAFNKWQASLIGVLSRYVVLVDTKTPAVPCRGAPPAWTAPAVSAAQLPLPKCEGRSDTDLLQLMGRHGQPFDAITTIVNVVMSYGMCTVPDRDGFNSYGDFMMARTMNSKWRTFKTRSLEEDAVVFLWDILYQAREVFMKQRWMGVAAMQQPFDFLAISDIIYEVQPDVIVETGTANGGSALMWASVLELNGLVNSSVITVDIQKPGVAGAFGADPPAAVMTANGQIIMVPKKRPQQNPVLHPLWEKYVTFVEGSSIEPATITRIKVLLQQRQHALWQSSSSSGGGVQQAGAAGVVAGSSATAAAAAAVQPAAGSSQQGSNSSGSGSGSSDSTAHERHVLTGAGTTMGQQQPQQEQLQQQQLQQRPLRVMVLLDSHHAAAHVLTEMEAYCPLVSPGSFCVIEDTKLSRWTNSDPGPLASVQSFLAWHPEFAVDRDRELLFTHHPYGYLQRLY